MGVYLLDDPLKKGLLYAGLLFLGYEGLKLFARHLFRDVGNDILKTITSDPYAENLWELVSATYRATPQVIVESNLRAQEGTVIQRPLGPPKRFPSLDQLMFNIAQLHVMPTPLETPVDTRVVIGQRCKRPLAIDLPILIAPMAYGVALSEKAKIALAKGAAMAGTAINNGEGPFLAAEREAAKKYILQYNRGSWNKTPDILRKADAIEIQFGQGAIGGVGHVLPSAQIDAPLRKSLGLQKGEDAVIHSRHLEVSRPADLGPLINKLKDICGDIPIGAKIGAGKYLENDLELLVEGGVDFIAVDGADAATKGSAPILQDDFGVPTMFAVDRAANYLKRKNLHREISLLAAGKIRTPGEVLKVLALGADAVYMGSINLFVISHLQVAKVLPFEPPTQLLWYGGKGEGKFKVNKGANNLCKFLQSCREELIEGVRGLGKTSIGEVNKDDLFALDEFTARGLGIPLCYERSH